MPHAFFLPVPLSPVTFSLFRWRETPPMRIADRPKSSHTRVTGRVFQMPVVRARRTGVSTQRIPLACLQVTSGGVIE